MAERLAQKRVIHEPPSATNGRERPHVVRADRTQPGIRRADLEQKVVVAQRGDMMRIVVEMPVPERMLEPFQNRGAGALLDVDLKEEWIGRGIGHRRPFAPKVSIS